MSNSLAIHRRRLALVLAHIHTRFDRGCSGGPRAPAPFVVGSPRSGTTLLRMMLDSHAQIAIPPETGFLPATLKLLPGSSENRRRAFLRRVVDFPSGAPGWQDFGISRHSFWRELKSIVPFRLDEGLRCFYGTYAARFHKPRWGDKTPCYGRYMRAIQRVLPEARFIHILRDGRDVALSLRGLWFSPGDAMATLAHQWRRDVLTARHESVGVRHYLEVRYESLVRDPEIVLKRICDFIDIDYDPGMLGFHARAGLRLDEHQARHRGDGSLLVSRADRLRQQQRVTGGLDAARVFRWRTSMTPRERTEYAAVAGDLLAALDYDDR